MSGSIYWIEQSYTALSLPIPDSPKPLSRLPYADIVKPRRESPAALLRSGCSLVRKVELKRHLHELLNFLAPDLRRRELHTGERILHGGGETRIA